MNLVESKKEKTKIAILFFAHNLDKKLDENLKKVKDASENILQRFNDYSFNFYFVDDGSTDNTRKILEAFVKKEKTEDIHYEILGDLINLGLAERIRYTLSELLKKDQFNYVIKTDLDGDFEFLAVLSCLLSYVGSSFVNVVASRWIEPDRFKIYEKKRREEILEIMEDNQKALNLDSLNVMIKDFDPASAGTQLYRSDILKEIINHPLIKNYNKRWGLDFLVPLIVLGLKDGGVKIEKIKGNYQRGRREFIKIKNQFDIYIEIIANLLNKKPEELSEYYFYNHK